MIGKLVASISLDCGDRNRRFSTRLICWKRGRNCLQRVLKSDDFGRRTPNDGLSEVLDRVAEEAQAGSFAAQAEAGPVGMLRGKQKTFGVRHQAEHSAARIAQAGEVRHRAVRIDRVWERH